MRLSYSSGEIDVDATAQDDTFSWKLAGETEATTTFHVDVVPSGGSESWALEGSLDAVDYFPIQLVYLHSDLVDQAPIGGSGFGLTVTHGPWPFMRLNVLQSASTSGTTTLKVWSHG